MYGGPLRHVTCETCQWKVRKDVATPLPVAWSAVAAILDPCLRGKAELHRRSYLTRLGGSADALIARAEAVADALADLPRLRAPETDLTAVDAALRDVQAIARSLRGLRKLRLGKPEGADRS